MSVMSYTVNSTDLARIGTVAKIKSTYINIVTKRLTITPGNAIVDRTIINPEQAYVLAASAA